MARDFYGKYRAIVKETQDPENRGRIKVECPAVLGKQVSAWALPCFPPKYFSIPPKGSIVWVEFEGGFKEIPIWVGVMYTKDTWKSTFNEPYQTTKVLIPGTTKTGKVEAQEVSAGTVSTTSINTSSINTSSCSLR